jgi:predicted N-acetyltransferase YhbS
MDASTGLAIRAARADDAALLHALLASAFREYEGRLDPPSGAHAETIDSIAGKLAEGGALICCNGAVPVGCIFYAPRADHLYVGRLAVLPSHRQRGIGDLLRAAEAQAAPLGLPAVRLGVRLALETLRAYYAARGYRPIALHAHAGYAAPTFVEMEKRLAGNRSKMDGVPPDP